MAEYIEREAFEEDARLRYCKDCTKRQHEVYCRSCWVDDMLGEVEDAPAADVVEVVRCKDCKWWNKAGCAICIVDETDKPKENDFCSFGEKMDGKGEHHE